MFLHLSSRLLVNGYLPQVLSDEKGGKAVGLGIMHRSPGIYLTAEKTSDRCAAIISSDGVRFRQRGRKDHKVSYGEKRKE